MLLRDFYIGFGRFWNLKISLQKEKYRICMELFGEVKKYYMLKIFALKFGIRYKWSSM